MNIDNLIKEWGNYERNRIEQGSGFTKQTVIARWIESQSHGGFSSRWPTGIQYKNLTSEIVRVRLAVDDLQDSYRNIIWYKFVGKFPIRVIQEELNCSHMTIYRYISNSKKLISLHFSNN